MSIELLRCDDRLIHGQCITRVIVEHQIEHIIMVDDFTASNPIISNIYKMAVPATVKITIPTVADAPAQIEAAAGDGCKTLVLVKDPIVALALQKATDKLPKTLNVGPMSNRNGSFKATYFSYLLGKEQEAMNGLEDMGVRVYFQQVPGEKEVFWADLRKELKS